MDFQDQNIITSHSTVNQISTFPKYDNISIERLFSTDQFLLKDLGVYDSCSWLSGFRIKITMSFYRVRQIWRSSKCDILYINRKMI